jgi:hypothetical protein
MCQSRADWRNCDIEKGALHLPLRRSPAAIGLAPMQTQGRNTRVARRHFLRKDELMAQLDNPAAGGDSVVSDGAPANQDPIETIADSFFEEEAEGDGDAAPELEADDVPDEEEEAAEPAIAPPVSWSAEEKERFKALPREVQETLARRESERERFVQSKAEEAAAMRARAHQEALAEIGRLSQEHAEQFRFVLPHSPERPSYQLQVDDPIAFAEQMDAHERALAQHDFVQQQIGQARQQAAQVEQMLRAQAQQAFHQVLSRDYPEFLDPSTGPKLREQLGSIALELGFPVENLADVDASDVLAMRKASEWKAKADKYDALMSQKMEKVREAKSLPRLSRPGSAQPRSQSGTQAVERSWERAKASRRPEDFADYLTKAGLL